jgi:predicted enzyme related to lactoylglutathione lyase
MTILKVECVTINASDPGALATFWAALIGGVPQEAGNGYVLVKPDDGRVPLLFQQADGSGPQPAWVHVDCSAADPTAAIEEVCRLGGRVVERRSDGKFSWTVLADPEGNPFCIEG